MPCNFIVNFIYKKHLSSIKINHIKDSEFITLIFKYILKLVTNIYFEKIISCLLFGFYRFILIVALFSYVFKR
jgi:hypothetical protein